MQEQQNPPRIEDPNEYNQRRRLQDIADARSRAAQAVDALEAGLSLGENASVNDIAYSAVQSLALEIEWLVKKHGDEKYLTQELGPISIHPPDIDDFEDQHDGSAQIRSFVGGRDLDPVTVNVRGLYYSKDTGRGFVETPQRLTDEWTVHARTRHHGPLKLTARSTVAIPTEVTKQAFRLCTKFINDHELDASIEDEKPHGGI